MKKILVLLVVFVLFGCASIPLEFNPTVTPFEGEWCNFDPDFNKLIYKITGNRWEFTYKDVHLTGLFTYTEKIIYTYESIKYTEGKIQFVNENGKWTQGYELYGPYQFTLSQRSTGRLQTGFGQFIKQPYGDLAVSYISKEKSFSDIVSNREELNRIQGTIKGFSVPVLYTFSGDQFSCNAPGKKPVTGTVKIRDNILYLIISEENFGFLYVEYLPNNKIFLHDLGGNNPDLWAGRFIKQ
jgi:hypothetical protein